MITRRYFMRACGAAAFASESLPFTLAAQLQGNLNDDSVTENQRGDPDIPDEYVTFSPSAIEHIVSKSRKATFEQWDRNLPLTMLVTARNFIGYNRKDNPEQISKFLDLFDLPIATGAGVVPFCAAGLSYCALTAYARKLSGISDQAPTRERLRKLMPDVEHYYFYPTVSCVDLYHIAAGKRRWVPHTPVQRVHRNQAGSFFTTGISGEFQIIAVSCSSPVEILLRRSNSTRARAKAAKKMVARSLKKQGHMNMFLVL